MNLLSIIILVGAVGVTAGIFYGASRLLVAINSFDQSKKKLDLKQE